MVAADRTAEAVRVSQFGAGVRAPRLLPGLVFLLSMLPASAATVSDTFLVRASVTTICVIPAGLFLAPGTARWQRTPPCMATPRAPQMPQPQPIVTIEHDDGTGGARLVMEF